MYELINIHTGVFWRVWVMDPKGIHLAFPLYRDSATRNEVERGVLNLNQLRSCFRTVNFQNLGIRLHPTCSVDGVTCPKPHQALNRWVPWSERLTERIAHSNMYKFRGSANMDVANARMKEQYENLRFAHTFADVLPNLKRKVQNEKVCKDATWLSQDDDLTFCFPENKNQRKRKMTIRQNARIKS